MRVIKKLNLHLFLYPQNICAHFSIVLTKNRRHTTSCKYQPCFVQNSLDFFSKFHNHISSIFIYYK